MNLRTLFLKNLIAVFALGFCFPALAAYNAPAGPTAKSNATKKPADKAEPKIPGFTIKRDNGGFLGLEIDDNTNFKLSFYDANKKPVAPDVARAALRWHQSFKIYDQRTVLNPSGDGKSMTSSYVVRRPWNFKLYIFLFVEGNETAVEHYIVDFQL
ncbi:MAG: hypothetical protein KGJ37_00075 [Verrucomicrobiota bacterium]|nr:hypothetical protein [Verrucomicrobiota bacterium]